MAPHEGVVLLPPLTAAVVVCRATRYRRKRRACALDGDDDDAAALVPVDALPDIVTHIVSTFLDYTHPKCWSMTRACERNLPRAHALNQGKTRFVWTARVPLYIEQFEIFEWLCEQQRPSRDKSFQLRMTRSAEAYTMALLERVGG
ncbi:hypothetical protein FI667_g14886, partial [Globisporangium splendens]